MKFYSYFGVTIPAWEQEKMGAGQFTIRFVVQGRVVSKKNNQLAVARTREAKDFLLNKPNVTLQDALEALKMVKAKMRPNKEYQEFLNTFKPVIQEQMKYWEGQLGCKGLKFPLQKAALSLKFYFADRYVTDTVNKQQSIQDLLVDCGVVKDDDYATLNPIVSKSASYFGKLRENICFISLSFKVENIQNDS